MTAPADAGQNLRPYSIQDAFDRRQIGEVVVSPDGTLIAFGLERPATRAERYVAQASTYGEILASRRSDVIVLSASDGQVVWTTHLEGTGTSALRPRWSPDGQRLAFLLTEPSAATFLAVWSRRAAQYERLGARPLDLVVPLRSDATGDGESTAFAWRDNRTVLAVTRAGMIAPLGPERLEALESRWRKTWQGEKSVRVWNSEDRPFCGAGGELVQLDADHPDTMVVLANGAIKGVSVSRDGSIAFVVANRRVSSPAKTPLAFPPLRNAVDMDQFVGWEVRVMLSGGSATPALRVAEGEGPVSSETLPRWSADSKRLAVMTRSIDGEGGIRNGGFVWTRAGGPVQPFNTDSFEAARVKMFDAVGAAHPSRQPTTRGAAHAPFERSVGRAARGRDIVVADAPDGSFIYATDRRGTRAQLAAFNTYFAGIATPRIEKIPYRVHGTQREGVLMLPTRAVDDGPPPIVVIAYPRKDPLRTDGAKTSFNNQSAHYYAPLMAHGYAVFEVDFRRPPQQPAQISTKDNVLSEVLPALEALENVRLADSKRLGFWGYSYGGYTALTLLAYTQHFKAIVAWAPLGDLAQYAYSVRSENEFDACAADLSLTSAREIEDPGGFEHGVAFLRQAAPQFAAPEKFLENSPTLNLGAAVSPALLSVGEFDEFANGARNAYLALTRRGIPTQLLQFNGEGHNLGNPANLAAQCEATLRWFDRYLRPDMPQTGPVEACSS